MSTNLIHRKKLPPLFITKDLEDDELENLFTDREETIETLMHSINLFVKKGERRHVLIVGDRGVGKSTVMMKIKKDINEKWHDKIIPLFYMDWDFSHYGDIGDVLLEAARGINKKIDLPMEMESNLFSIESKISHAESIFNQVPVNKKIILVIENFDTYLKMDNRNKHEREKLRTFVENHENILLIGTSVQYPKKQLSSYNHPFFGFFETIIPLEPFDEDYFIQQVEKLAKYYDKTELLEKNKLKKNYVRKLKSIHNITSGFPRLGVCLFDTFITDDPVEMYEIFDSILDTLTPYFEGIRDRMSDKEKLAYRLIVDTTMPCIVHGTFSISSLTETGNIDPDLMRSLLSKLNKKGFIKVVSRKKRKKIYRVSNPMFSVWFMKVHIKGTSEAGKPILEFAYAFYSMEDIEDISKVKSLIKYKEDIGHGIAASLLKRYYVSGAFEYTSKFVEKGNYERASDYLDKIDIKDIDSEKGKNYARLRKGALQLLKGENNKAMKVFDGVLDIDLENVPAWVGKATTFLGLGKYDDAIACYDKALEFDPESFIWNGKGNALSELGKPEDAIKAYEKAIELDPKDTSSWNRKGNALSELGKPEDALVCYDKALELDPSDASTLGYKGIELFGLGKVKDASIVFEELEILLQKDESAEILRLLLVKIMQAMVATLKGNETEITELIKSALKYSVTIDETTQNKVEILILAYDYVLEHMPHIAVESIEYLKELEKDLPKEERFALSFEPISIAGKYLIEGDKEIFEGLSDTMRKQVDMVLERIEKKVEAE
ncbi:MAG: tetratricopeptide repeat protein [Candidatus Peribacteraceae bacterium]|nr:tetratricopeptide repeat protein [Candidatus Peribacteraceae bacterium]